METNFVGEHSLTCTHTVIDLGSTRTTNSKGCCLGGSSINSQCTMTNKNNLSYAHPLLSPWSNTTQSLHKAYQIPRDKGKNNQ